MSEDFRELERIQNHEEGHLSSRFYQDFEAFVRMRPLDMGYQPVMHNLLCTPSLNALAIGNEL